MADRFDAIVVGARVAGAPLATHLARAGLSVCLLDRAGFPSDTLSTHIFQDIPCVERLGVLDRLLATGAPLLTELSLTIDDAVIEGSFPDLPMLCVRRPALDQVLVDNAIEAGAEVRSGTRVTGLLDEDGGRVGGVRTKDAAGTVSTLRAPVVVGADGRNSTIAKLVGARRYNVIDNERAGAWAYYEGVEAPPPQAVFYRKAEDIFAWCPTDGGVFLVIAIPSLDAFPAYRDSDGAGFDRAVATCGPLASRLDGARRIRRPILVARFQGYFRESAGPGWCLVGDAGHFKDPTPGQGISDAFRQAERLAAFIVAGLRDGSVDEQLRAYWSWRDQDAAEMYWFAQDLGRAGTVPPLVAEMFRKLLGSPDGVRRFYEVWHHRRAPSTVLTPGRLLGASARLLVRDGRPRREILAETKEMIVLGRQRKRLEKHPQFEQGEPEVQPDDDLLVPSA